MMTEVGQVELTTICASREVHEETGIGQQHYMLLDAYLDYAPPRGKFRTRFMIAQVEPTAFRHLSTHEGVSPELRYWKPPHEDPDDQNPVVRASIVRITQLICGRYWIPPQVRRILDAAWDYVKKALEPYNPMHRHMCNRCRASMSIGGSSDYNSLPADGNDFDAADEK